MLYNILINNLSILLIISLCLSKVVDKGVIERGKKDYVSVKGEVCEDVQGWWQNLV